MIRALVCIEERESEPFYSALCAIQFPRVPHKWRPTPKARAMPDLGQPRDGAGPQGQIKGPIHTDKCYTI